MSEWMKGEVKEWARAIFYGAALAFMAYMLGYFFGAGVSEAVDRHPTFYHDYDECKDYALAPLTGLTATDVECKDGQ